MKYIVVDAAKEQDRREFVYTLAGALRALNRHVFITTESDLPREARQVPTLADGGCSIDDLIFAQQKICRRIAEWNRQVPNDTYVIQDGGWLTQVRRGFRYKWNDGRTTGLRNTEVNRLGEAWRAGLRNVGVSEQYVTLLGNHKDQDIAGERMAWYDLKACVHYFGQEGCVASSLFVFHDRPEEVWADLRIKDLPPYTYVEQRTKRPMLTKLRI
jgi:hypothetical protein